MLAELAGRSAAIVWFTRSGRQIRSSGVRSFHASALRVTRARAGARRRSWVNHPPRVRPSLWSHGGHSRVARRAGRHRGWRPPRSSGSSPLAPVRGRGARLVEADGRELIDLSGSWGAAGLGYSHPAIVEAVSRAVAEMPGASALSLINAEAIALAEELIATLPDSAGHVAYIGLSGSDANAAALRCVRAATGRQRVVSFDGSYHGGLGPGREVSGLLTADGPDAARRQFVAVPRAGRPPSPPSTTSAGPWPTATSQP